MVSSHCAVLLQEREEPFEPSFLVYRVIGLGPDAELLAVIGHDREPVPLGGLERRQMFNGLLGPVERDQIAELFAPGEDL